MAKVDPSSVLMNPSAYSQVRGEEKKEKGRAIRRGENGRFSRVFNEFRAKTGDELGPLRDLPVSEETAVMLMDEVHSAGSALKDRPFPDEIVRYKQAVRHFMYYVVENSFTVEFEKGLPRFMLPGFTGQRGTDESRKTRQYTKIQVIDKKLEDMAAGILAGQRDQLKLIAGLEEINGLLIDLLQ
jgi:uncharacterized protein YaaR (DUF327 family)